MVIKSRKYACRYALNMIQMNTLLHTKALRLCVHSTKAMYEKNVNTK